MNKAELIANVAKQADLERPAAERAVDVLIASVVRALSLGEAVSLDGFGEFRVQDRQARIAKNPKTGKPLNVLAKRIPRFVPGAGFKLALNNKG